MRDVLSSILFNSNNCAASAAWVEVSAPVSSFPVPFVLIVDKTQIIHNTTTHSRYNNIQIILPDHPKKSQTYPYILAFRTFPGQGDTCNWPIFHALHR